ncbi:hypothetical protein [Flavobacterium sp. ZS1P14]|uniref:hypothetical protein n=1 Tax=Flavobacterium sp. ZS1P14 TaxID=3401729 RepID=UPI003AB0B13A
MKTIERNIEEKLNKEIKAVIKHSKISWAIAEPNAITYLGFFKNKLLLIQVIKDGVPYSLFENIQSYSPFSETDWSKFLAISTKSPYR